MPVISTRNRSSSVQLRSQLVLMESAPEAWNSRQPGGSDSCAPTDWKS
jgi:hypothetical protein